MEMERINHNNDGEKNILIELISKHSVIENSIELTICRKKKNCNRDENV